MLPLFVFLLLFADESGDAIDRSLKRFTDVFSVIRENAADPVSSAQAVNEGAIPGMLRKLDPHSVYFDPTHFEQLKEMEKSTRKGFGSIVSLLPGRVIVLQTLPNTPSARSGLNPGDEIVAINGIALNRLEVEQLVQLLTEARQHQVRIDVRRQGNARLLPLMLTPEDVEASSVDRAYFLSPQVGYIRITSFDVQTGKQIREAIDKLGGAELRGLVLDLRNNPGGILDAAVETAGIFLKPGQKIVSVKGRSFAGNDAVVPKEVTPFSFPLAVLINAKSASASEIVAGALQDHKRALLFGERSYGKGLVQSVFPLSQGAGLALTTAFYYTPSGRSIQRPLQGQLESTTSHMAEGGGIEPDQVVSPEPMTRLRAFLDGNAAFTSFSTDYLQRVKPKIDETFELSPTILDEFQAVLSNNNIRPGIAEWSSERDWLRNRLHQELFNLALGVDKGDQIEARRDPVVQSALRAVSGR
ncbi:MAG: S41 family peptidase [Bryobacteraceae bacterium]|nr:S41 family peptidase [Bryobacteraceae bacterium]